MHCNHFSTVSIVTTLLLCGCALKNPDTEEGSVESLVHPETEMQLGSDDLTGLPDVDGNTLAVSSTELDPEGQLQEIESDSDLKPSNLDDALVDATSHSEA